MPSSLVLIVKVLALNVKGSGIERVELAFLDDIEMTCDVCHGSGYAPEVLKYLYKDKNIAEILK